MGKETSQIARLFSLLKKQQGKMGKVSSEETKKAAGEENYSGILRNQIGSR
jgi:hypothetical protein